MTATIDIDSRPSVGPSWLDDDADDGPPLPFWEQVHRHRVRGAYEEVRSAWRRLDAMYFGRSAASSVDHQAWADALLSLHRALERLRVASSLPLT